MRVRVQLSSIYRDKTAMSWREQPAPAQEEMLEKLEKDIEMLSKRVRHHEDGITMLKTYESFLDESIIEMQDILEKYYISLVDSNEGANIFSDEQSESETIKQILMHKNSADALYYQLKTQQHEISQCVALNLKDVVGIVATLGKVHDYNLSRLLEREWKKHMLLENTYWRISTKWRKGTKKANAVGDLGQEESMLNCVKYSLEIKKREFVNLVTIGTVSD